MEQLLSHFSAMGFPESELLQITAAFKCKKTPKGDFFSEEDKTSKYLAFIIKDGKEITTYIKGRNTLHIILKALR